MKMYLSPDDDDDEEDNDDDNDNDNDNDESDDDLENIDSSYWIRGSHHYY